jgi:transcriptional regulator with XRE-family HTH domain
VAPSAGPDSLYNRVEGQHYQLLFMASQSVRNLAPLRFGREVRRRRRALGLTLEQLAERSGLTPNYIGTVENGRRDPSLSTISALARGLGVPTGELVGGVGDMSPEAIEAARLFDSAAPEMQGALLQLLRSVARRRR